jgi:DNA-binding transcriptional MocR family regulator
VFRRLGLRAVPIPTDAQGPDPQALAALAARTRPAMVYLVPAAGNPTGVVVPAHRLDAIAEVLAGSGVPLLEDRTAAPLANPATLPAPLTARLAPGAAVVVGSMSKVAWAGVRAGWVVAPAGLQRDLVAARIAVDLAGSLISQAVALHLVPHLPALAAAVRADLEQNQSALRAALAERLPSWTGDEPDAGGWRWLRLPGDARSLARAAAGHGVLVTPGPLFSAQAGLGDRVRIAAVESGEVLVEGVRRLATAWGAVQHDRPEATDGRDLLLI